MNKKLDVVDIHNKVIGTVDNIYTEETEPHSGKSWTLLDRAQKAGDRAGTASSKNRSAVRGGGAKPYKQKGTGRARRGTNRSPLRRGGGVIFGPSPRSFDIKLNKRHKRSLFLQALAKNSDKIVILDAKDLQKPNTKTFLKLNGETPSLLLTQDDNVNLNASARNLKYVTLATRESLKLDSLFKATKIWIEKNVYETEKQGVSDA